MLSKYSATKLLGDGLIYCRHLFRTGRNNSLSGEKILIAQPSSFSKHKTVFSGSHTAHAALVEKRKEGKEIIIKENNGEQ